MPGTFFFSMGCSCGPPPTPCSDQICATVFDTCTPRDSVYCYPCNTWLSPGTFKVTDALGVHPYLQNTGFGLGWLPNNRTFGTQPIAFSTNNLWNPDNSCTKVSGNGYYGYYWNCNPAVLDSQGNVLTPADLVIVQRVFMQWCPGSGPGNVLANSGFENGFAGWNTIPDPTMGIVGSTLAGNPFTNPSLLAGANLVGWNSYSAYFAAVPPAVNGLYQDITTVVGQAYELTFLWAAPGSAGGIAIFWDGNLFDTLGASSDYQQYAAILPAASTTTTRLGFLINNGGTLQPDGSSGFTYLDKVTLGTPAAGANADGTHVPSLFVDYAVHFTAPGCSPSFSVGASFPSVATAWGDGSGIKGYGDPPFTVLARPVSSGTLTATAVPGPYVVGATVQAWDQFNHLVGSGLTNVFGQVCFHPAPLKSKFPIPLWIGVVPPGGCACPINPPPRQEVVVDCGVVCVPTWPCSALAALSDPQNGFDFTNWEIGLTGGTVQDDHGSHAITFSIQQALWKTADVNFPAAYAFWEGSYYDYCSDGSGNFVPYHYTIVCNGTQVGCALWTYPIRACRFDNTVCGYYLGDSDFGTPATEVIMFLGSATPTLEIINGVAVNLVASFEVPPNTTCALPVPPPTISLLLKLPIKAKWDYQCLQPCPIPRVNLNLTWSGVSSGSAVLIWRQNLGGNSWSSNTGFYQFSGSGLSISGVGFLSPDYFTCNPTYFHYTSGGTQYVVQP